MLLRQAEDTSELDANALLFPRDHDRGHSRSRSLCHGHGRERDHGGDHGHSRKHVGGDDGHGRNHKNGQVMMLTVPVFTQA